MNYFGIFQIIGARMELVAAGLNYVDARAQVRRLNREAGAAAFTFAPYSL